MTQSIQFKEDVPSNSCGDNALIRPILDYLGFGLECLIVQANASSSLV